MTQEQLKDIAKNVTGYKSSRTLKDGSVWFKCITNNARENHLLHVDIFNLIESGTIVKCISEESISNAKVYASYIIK